MKKAIIAIIGISAVFAAGAAQRPQVENVPTEPEQTAVVVIYTACPPTEMPLAVSSKVVELTKQPKPITRYAPSETPQPAPEPTLPTVPVETPAPTPTLESTIPAHSSYGGYVPGFGWVESQGTGQCIHDTQIYENGNKVGIME